MISINYLLFSRPSFLELNTKIIQKISNENKKKIKINFLATDHELCKIDSNIMKYIQEVQDSGIETSFKVVSHNNNYLTKIRIGISDNYEYCIKWDEDCFLSHHLWNYLIENADKLMKDNLFVTVPLSTGIPSTDIFINNFFDNEEKNIINTLFKNTLMPFIWGFNYTSLNKFTVNSDQWNPDFYYEGLKKLNYHYSGIHPVRINYNAQKYILDTCIKKLDDIFAPFNHYITEINSPYFCNSFFMIRTKDWENILNNPSLFVDDFDEVALNRYWKYNNFKGIYINGTGAIHLYYNTINHFGFNFLRECQFIFDQLKDKYNEISKN
jgi:hypothetical protein